MAPRAAAPGQAHGSPLRLGHLCPSQVEVGGDPAGMPGGASGLPPERGADLARILLFSGFVRREGREEG
jgi:hypothetical protein